jgi:mannosylglycoprotein endo-beta-mannosidase
MYNIRLPKRFGWRSMGRISFRASVVTTLSLLALTGTIVVGSALALPQAARFGEYPERDVILLGSQKAGAGVGDWSMAQVEKVSASGAKISQFGFNAGAWSPALVPGTVLNSLVANKVYPEPYYGLNNVYDRGVIPDISKVGNPFYTYWFRTQFIVPTAFRGRRVWMQFDGINYRAEFWVNGRNLGTMAGMFNRGLFDVTDAIKVGQPNVLAVLVKPIDKPNGFQPKSSKPTAVGENRNGADGTIGQYTTMLMTAGWDFTFPDGIRDRNTGIWRNVKLFSTGPVTLRNPFVKSTLPLPDLSSSRQQISVEVTNATKVHQKGVLTATVKQAGIAIRKLVELQPGETKVVTLTPEEFSPLVVKNPRLWWPFNKGEQYLYNLTLQFSVDGKQSDQINTRFGIRDIRSDTNTPDKSRLFYVNGKRLFLHGGNWIPEAMLRNSPERMAAELRYTRQAGVNFLRFWAGGITESDQFFDLCDQLGILVSTEFWQSGDTQLPADKELYRANVVDTIKRIRPHASLAYYISANERAENSIVPIKDVLDQLDDTRGYQAGSEIAGIHDGSPYKTVNPMFHYEDTASPRGSRVYGLNPEYGGPILPTIDALREMIDEKDLWPINKPMWDYLDGGGFHEMTTEYFKAVQQYGPSTNIEDYAWKAQMFGALSYRSIWEVWNANRLDYGDRFASGLWFWYLNSPNRQVAGRMWDWSLEPTAALYFSQDAHEPVHVQFDFIKNTVSVNNELVRAFPGHKLTARIFNMDMTEAFRTVVPIDIPADRLMKDVLKVTLPANLSPVHFIRLDITDRAGKPVADTFYWRSNRAYKPGRTMTGPQYEGFEDLNKLPTVELQSKVRQSRRDNKNFTTVNVSNPSKGLAFMVWLRLQDAATGKPIRPAFYADNFLSLLPGESREVEIEYDGAINASQTKLIVDGWNVLPREFSGGKSRTLPVRERKVIAIERPVNLALGKKVTSSADEGSDRAVAYAVDGDSSTRWASGRTDNQWITVDLGTPQRIGKVSLNWEAAYAKKYKIQVSDDGGESWRDVAEVSNGTGGEDSRSFTPVTARYVRIQGIERGSEFGYSLWELGVYTAE